MTILISIETAKTHRISTRLSRKRMNPVVGGDDLYSNFLPEMKSLRKANVPFSKKY